MRSDLAADVSAHRVFAEHRLLGASTGFIAEHRGNWRRLVDEALTVSRSAIELSCLLERELPSLLRYLDAEPDSPFSYVSVHGPSKDREMPEEQLASTLAVLPEVVDAVVLHPDVMDRPSTFGLLGRRATIENMDARKDTGRTVDELTGVFECLPDAGFCLDIAHAWSVDPTMEVARDLVAEFAPRLRHLHVSSVTATGKHEPLTAEHEALFAPLLARCRHVPWILEAPLRAT